ncbi:TetR/AcrR family transcriptional regulator [Tsukamurella soli]|uniref:TetR/AcrR family transcriptional regulator n=1 Tax=Tsukamurella soli TaxID=644556 RepID=A0ABP8JBC2_9ACTN
MSVRSGEAGGDGRSRRRGAVLEQALLDAAWEELAAVGYAAVTIDAVAARAGTSRAVVYRRWRNRPELMIAALRRHRPMLSGEAPDTGSLRGDVRALLTRVAQRLTELGPETVFGLLGDFFADAEMVSRVQEHVLHIQADVMAAILDRARARGEIVADVPARVATLPVDLFRHELLVRRSPPSPQAVDDIVDQVFLPLVQLPLVQLPLVQLPLVQRRDRSGPPG